MTILSSDIEVCTYLSVAYRYVFLHSEEYTLNKSAMSWGWNISNSTYNGTEFMTILINILLSQHTVQHFRIEGGGNASVSALGIWYLEAFFTRNITFSMSSGFNFTNSTRSRQEANCTLPHRTNWMPMALGAFGSFGFFFFLLLICCCCPCPCIEPQK